MRNSERYQELYEEGYVEGFMHGYLQSGIEVIVRVRLEPKVSTELLLALVPDYHSALTSVKEDISVLSDERVEEIASESWRVHWKIAEEHARLMLERMLGERDDRAFLQGYVLHLTRQRASETVPDLSSLAAELRPHLKALTAYEAVEELRKALGIRDGESSSAQCVEQEPSPEESGQ